MTNNIIKKGKEFAKKIKINIQKSLLKKLIISKYRLEKKLDRIKIVKIENFTPKILSSREDNHSALLNEVIKDNNILNIALTGPYGSGKTSIIKTFEHNFSNLKFINISLATFDGKVIKDDKTSKLEYSILKQIFYKVSHDKVPQSRFKRIINYKYIRLKTGLLFLWISSIIYLSDFDFPDSLLTTKLIHTLWLTKLYAEILDFMCSIFAISGGIYFLYTTYDFFVNFKIGKLKVSEAEFDNKNDSKTIDFENEIDEILYFFDKNKTDVVFIEDLDRFDNTEIYIKLREINCLINNYQPIKKRGKVTFVYAVRDNMFDETERTKFFDIILPVIPVINYTNSSDKFLGALALNLNQISDLEEKSKFKDFIEVVSRYINDMRTIISICNEFKIYEKILGGSGIDKIKLLSMMIYKNIEPSDFDCLDKNKGYVYQLFKNKKDLIDTEIEKIDVEIRLIDEEKIEQSRKESFENIDELRKFYLYTFINLVNKKHNQIVKKIKVGVETLDETELIKDDNFNKFIIDSNISFSHSDYSGFLSSGYSFNNIENEINRKTNYKQRYERLKNKEREELDKLRKERQDLVANRERLISKRLSEILITQKSIDYFASTFHNYFTKPISTVQIGESLNQSNSSIEFKCVY
ncbi:P-loop NTPase fold protein, partial [Flavobacterium sp. A45]|uniref:YobI family P-loop NTPase n=1 Tax=Flavobacterium sp. A45 TaxID=1945862 RepID=UPI0009D00749